MTELRGYMEPGKRHSQVHLDPAGLCPLCLEPYIDGREAGGRTDSRTWYQQGVCPFRPPFF